MFRRIVKPIVVAILTWEAQLVLKKYRPQIVAVGGSVGKTGTKEAIAAVLGSTYRVRASQKSFNSEIGLPLTILNCKNAWWNPLQWLRNFIEGLGLILFHSPYPEWLVLEIGVDRPGDMAAILKWLPVQVAVLTRLPAVPVHVEFFKSVEAMIGEKWRLARAASATGLVVANGDDEKIKLLVNELKTRALTYGFNPGVDVRGSNVHVLYNGRQKNEPRGLGLKVDYDGKSVPFQLNGVLGQHQLYALLAATAIGVAQGINLVTISEALTKLIASPGRMKLIAGLKDTLIIDDSYNSSPAALEAALRTLGELQVAGRKIAVLGDMLELGQFTIEEHRQAGAEAAEVADVLVTVGLRMKFAVEEAVRKKMGKRSLHHFDEARAAGQFLQNFIAAGDVVLVKGSQSLRLERVVEEIMAEPEKRGTLLVRQDKEWEDR